MAPTYSVHLLITLVLSAETAKILGVYPTPSFSHHVVFRSLMLELAKRGHDITIITTHPVFKKGDAPENYKEIDVEAASAEWVNIPNPSGIQDNIYNDVKKIIERTSYIFYKQLEIDEVRKINDDKSVSFDLVIVEAWFRPALSYHHKFKVPIIKFGSFGGVVNEYNLIGSADHPVIYLSPFAKKIRNLTIWDEISQFYTRWSLLNMHESFEDEENKALRRYFGSDMPTLTELSNEVDAMMLNIHHQWEMNRPHPLNLITVGGIHIRPGEELPKDLKLFLDSSIYGVIYVSFGTNCDTSLLPPKQVAAMVNVLSRLPYDVLWKSSDDVLPKIPNNFRISKWFPQQDLLNHSNIKLFVTQGGLQSTEEAIANGVPLLGVPLFADQYYNVEIIVQLNIGLYLPLHTFTEQDFEDKIDRLIKHGRYRNNVIKVRDLLYDTPQSPLERAVWLTEHVLRHGARHLRAPAHNMHWTEYLEIELLGIFSICVLLFTIFVVFIIIKSSSFIWKAFINCNVTLKRYIDNIHKQNNKAST